MYVDTYITCGGHFQRGVECPACSSCKTFSDPMLRPRPGSSTAQVWSTSTEPGGRVSPKSVDPSIMLVEYIPKFWSSATQIWSNAAHIGVELGPNLVEAMPTLLEFGPNLGRFRSTICQHHTQVGRMQHKFAEQKAEFYAAPDQFWLSSSGAGSNRANLNSVQRRWEFVQIWWDTTGFGELRPMQGNIDPCFVEIDRCWSKSAQNGSRPVRMWPNWLKIWPSSTNGQCSCHVSSAI